jgi:hemerythrin-like domain-containing protein
MSTRSSGADAPRQSPVENFRRQHQDLLALAGEIGGRLTPERVAGEAAEVRRLLAQFAGKLNVHARMENDALYPRLLEHADEAVRRQAEELLGEVGEVYDAFGAFLVGWPTAASIEAAPSEFIRQAVKVFRLLAKRMLREEHQLYPLVEAAR